jgi:hypothetical protein
MYFLINMGSSTSKCDTDCNEVRFTLFKMTDYGPSGKLMRFANGCYFPLQSFDRVFSPYVEVEAFVLNPETNVDLRWVRCNDVGDLWQLTRWNNQREVLDFKTTDHLVKMFQKGIFCRLRDSL